tara:strand:+ start:300 stop:584 length:285 start_codon:yes stop_codon:yes gene_type:complete
MIYIILTIISVFCLISLYLLFLSLKRINQLEQIIIEISNIIEYVTKRVKIIDNKGHFEADDEIGFFFEEIKRITKILNNLFVQTTEDNNAKEKS